MKDDKIKVSIIIPHYNQKDCLQVLFPDIVNQTYKDYEVIIIDDCTPDKLTIDFVRTFIKDRPNWQLVQNPVNLRFVRTVNRGTTLAKGEYLCFLNSDTSLKNTFIQRNVEILDSDPTIVGLTSIIVDKSGQNWFSGGRYIKGFPVNLKDDFDGLRTEEFIAGTAVFYKREIFNRVGHFDGNYIMYHEDVEFGLRVKQLTGYRLCTFSEKLATHLIIPSIPGPNLVYFDSRNLLLLSRRFAPRYLLKILGNILWRATARLIGSLLSMLSRKPSSALFKYQCAVAGFRGALSGITARQTRLFPSDSIITV